MYLRQMKQFLRNARPDFDERRYGSLQDLLRACQKAGLVRLERDRQGGLRAFAGAVKPSGLPQGWVAPDSETAAESGEMPAEAADMQTAIPEPLEAVAVTESDAAETAPVVEAGNEAPSVDQAPRAFTPSEESDEGDDQVAMFGVLRPTDPEPVKARRPAIRRSRKTPDFEIEGRPKRARKTPIRTGSRRSRS